MMMRRSRRGRSKRAGRNAGQSMTELIILVAIVALSLAWIVTALPAAISSHYKENAKFLAGPF
jgi:Tfp pilus assembly protein FimT